MKVSGSRFQIGITIKKKIFPRIMWTALCDKLNLKQRPLVDDLLRVGALGSLIHQIVYHIWYKITPCTSSLQPIILNLVGNQSEPNDQL